MIRFSTRPNRAGLIEWHEWGEAAFQSARRQDKPVLLFIGAFWCGICQRMDETSFSRDEAIAMLNTYFVCIRVEESQRPDVDLRYNQDGWPTIVFLRPSGELLFSVNYVPPDAFIELLVTVVDSYQRQNVASLVTVAQSDSAHPISESDNPADLSPAIVAEIAGMIEGLADPVHGGFGSADKLFHAEATEFLLHLFEATGRQWYLDHVLLTLRSMRGSRTFDAQGGGFFRYSSQPDWQEPHPEKLLDDQAALLSNYLHAYVLTDATEFRKTSESLASYLNATMLDEARGAFFGCQDYVRPTDASPELQSVVDTCIYCDANARTASAYFDAWWILGLDGCAERARTVLEWLWANLRAPDGGMYHYYWDGAARVPGLLMDSVMTGRALLGAYALASDSADLQRAEELAQDVVRNHLCERGGFFDISATGPAALAVPMTVLSQNATLASFFARLACLSGDSHYRDMARWALQPFPNSHRRYGAFAAGFGLALSQLLAEPQLITITGPPGDPEVRRLLRSVLTQSGPRYPVVRFREAAPGRAAVIEPPPR